MGRNIGPVCRLCRREGTPLMLKGQRCMREKCSLKKRKYAPGFAGQKKTKLSEYGIQLREKQKIKRFYGLLEKQFKLTFFEAQRRKGVTGDNLIILLESRLDNVVYRAGFASSRKQARQLINHGHVLVNSKSVNIPSFLMKDTFVVTLKQDLAENLMVSESIKLSKSLSSKPEWLDVDYDNRVCKVTRLPRRDDITMVFNEQLVVELYSK